MASQNRQSAARLYGKKLPPSKRVAVIGTLVALALIFSYVEFLIPFNFGVPGIKLGLANIVIIIGLYVFGLPVAFSVSLIRTLLNGLLFAGIFSALYGMAGAILSLVGMYFLKKSGRFSIVGVSVCGSFLHIIGQLTIAALVFGNIKVFIYLPFLTIVSVVTGALIGFTVYLTLEKVKPFLRFGRDFD